MLARHILGRYLLIVGTVLAGVLVVFLVANRRIVEGVRLSGLKG